MKQRIVSLILLLCLLLTCLPAAAAVESGPDAVVIACSDFQSFEDSGGGYSGSYTNNIALVRKILGAMDYPAIDGFLCGGDYNFTETMNNVAQTETGVRAIHDTLKGMYPELSEDRMVLIQGNHDAAGTPGLAVTGPYEAEAYSVYAINEDDYMNYNADEARIRVTAQNLETYLRQKAEADYDHPIFVITHLPLHFTTRTQKNGDGQYAHYLFDLLNQYGEELNIIFLYGHNHAFGYDSYMGASSVFLQRGDKINVALLGSRTKFTEETLNFTYMNYGYVGYYWFNYDTSGGAVTRNPPADGTLTMTSFEITGNEVVIHRWDETGLHDLKAPGKQITSDVNGTDYEDLWPANELTYGPTARVGAPAPLVTYTDGNASVTTAAPIGGIVNNPGWGHETAQSLELRPLEPVPEGYTYTVTLRLPAHMATHAVKVRQGDRELTALPAPDPLDPAFGTLTFRTDSLGAFHLSLEGNTVSYNRETALEALPETGRYLLFVSNTHKTSGSNLNADYVMLPVSKYVSSAGAQVPLDQAYRTGFDIRSAAGFDPDNHTTLQGEQQDLEWTLERSGQGWLLKTPAGEGARFDYKDANAATVTLSGTEPTLLALAPYGNTDTFTLGTAAPVNGVTYFFDYNTRGLICGYRAHANDVHFYLYRRTEASAYSGDTSWLEEALDRAKALREADYVPATWEPLAAAVARAEALLAEIAQTPGDVQTRQPRLNAAWLDLTDALEGLELTLAKQGVHYEAVTDPAALTSGEDYYPVLWRDFGTETSAGFLLTADALLPVTAAPDYGELTPDRALPETGIWRLVNAPEGLILRHRATGNYLAGAEALLTPDPTLLDLISGLCGGFANYAVGASETSLGLEGETLAWLPLPAGEAVTEASGANLRFYRKVVDPERENLAPDGIPEGPAISSWCNIGGVNDGVIPDSSDTGDYNVAYGSWNGSGSPLEQTITITLDRPARIEGAAAFFWYNADGPHTQVGIDFPASYTWEYLDEAGAWTPVPNPRGLETREDVLNRTDFDPVTTSALRIVMEKEASGSFGLGVAELELYGYYPAEGAQTLEPDPAALELALALALPVDLSPYTEDSAEALTRAIQEGRTLLRDPDASQEALDAAARTVREALAGLELRPDPFRFEDVQDEGKYFFEPVYWAYNHEPQITNGTSDTLFSPGKSCTRAQVVTFLYRAAGEPEVENVENPFTDLKETGYYYKAVLWAVENEITAGTSATTFSPNANCTRAQIVTFLWRYAGKPPVEGMENPFTDVPAGKSYSDAVLWAYANEITKGKTDTTFVPGGTCSRGEVVTFLYRLMG